MGLGSFFCQTKKHNQNWRESQGMIFAFPDVPPLKLEEKKKSNSNNFVL